jgi:DNA-binding CsgD family transcriptional regulator/PAS domain-containing protein
MPNGMTGELRMSAARAIAPSTEKLLDLVGRIYTTAVKPTEMTACLEALTDCLGATFTQTYTYDRQNGFVVDAQISHHALTDKAHDDYTREWHRYDPRPKAQATLPSGSVLLCHEHFDEKYVSRSAFYQEYFIPIGLRWAMGAMYHSEDGTSTLVAGLRAPDLPHFDVQSASTLKLVAPHFVRAQLLREDVNAALLAASRAESIVEAMRQPAMLVDHRGRVLFLNHQAEETLSRISVTIRGSVLFFPQPSSELAWRSAVQRFAQTKLPQDAQIAGTPAHIELVPIHGLGFNAGASEARMALAVIRGIHPASQQLDSLTRAYALSSAELDVLQALSAGLAAKQIAARRQTSVNTVRAQMRRLFEKTGSRSQRELLLKCLEP